MKNQHYKEEFFDLKEKTKDYLLSSFKTIKSHKEEYNELIIFLNIVIFSTIDVDRYYFLAKKISHFRRLRGDNVEQRIYSLKY